MTELREIFSSPWEYMRDKWNVLDVIALALLAVGFMFRFGGTGDISKNLYALAAPFFYARILFFAQILPSQGPMIQVCVTLCVGARDPEGAIGKPLELLNRVPFGASP